MVWELAPCCVKYSHVDLCCVGNAGIVEKRGESSAGKVRGGWILFTWGRSLFPIRLKRAVCLGQHSTDFWSGWGGQEVITGCTWTLESPDNFRDTTKSQWKSWGHSCSNYPTLWNLPALTHMVMDPFFWGVGTPFVSWCLLLGPQVQKKTVFGSGLASLRSS